MTDLSRHRGLALGILAVTLVVSAVLFLAGDAQRDWSLHWTAPQTVLPAVSSVDYAVGAAPGGFDLAWSAPDGGFRFGRYDAGTLTDQRSLSGSPQTPSVASFHRTGVVVWRQDTSNGSELRAAIMTPHSSVRYLTMARGVWSLEHPYAFTAPTGVDVVFSWQRSGNFDVYLVHISPSGRASAPIRLTHAGMYAFYPRALVDAAGVIHLLYMNETANGFDVIYARYTESGRLLSHNRADTITSIGGPNSSSAPNQWGFGIARDGNEVWAAWAGDPGIEVAAWRGATRVVAPAVVVPASTTYALALPLSGSRRDLVWAQAYSLGVYLGTVAFNAGGVVTAPPDRVVYEGAAAAEPYAVPGGEPSVVWEATTSQSGVSELQLSRYSPAPLPAPSIWARLGLGLGNPISTLALLLVAAIAIGALLTVANILTVFVLTLLYFLVQRLVPARWRWPVYVGVILVAIYLMFVNPGLPSPPLLFLSSLAGSGAIVALVTIVIVIVLLTRTFLFRVDDLYRAGAMAFAAIYVLAFLQALTLVQGQIARI